MAGPVDPSSGPPTEGSLSQQKEEPCGGRSRLVTRVLYQLLTPHCSGRGWNEVWILKERTWLRPSGLARFSERGYSGSFGGA